MYIYISLRPFWFHPYIPQQGGGGSSYLSTCTLETVSLSSLLISLSFLSACIKGEHWSWRQSSSSSFLKTPPKKRLRSFYIQRGGRTFPESIETLEEIKRRVGGMSRTQRLRGYKEGKGIRIDSMMFRQHHVDRSSPPLRTSQFHERANPAENRNGSGIEKAPHSARPLVHDTVSWPFFFFFSGLFIYLSICSILLSFFLRLPFIGITSAGRPSKEGESLSSNNPLEPIDDDITPVSERSAMGFDRDRHLMIPEETVMIVYRPPSIFVV